MSRRRTTPSNARARRPRRQVKRLVEGQVLTLDDRRIPLIYQRNSRARRIILRFDQSDGRIVVVLPPRATYDEGRRFAQTHRAWIRERIELLPEGVPFAPGKTVPFLGQPHRIRHRPKARGVVWCEEGEIHVAGRPEHLSRRVEDWLKLEARREIAELAHEKAARIGKRVRRVRLRDPKTRWASCSASAELAFSWRLVLAPKWVLDYVVAHEVAHLREMNHEPRFWRLVDELTPYARKARAWLAEHGPDLHRYGRGDGERALADPLPL
jgi:predicted metal-dependent hydrolase